MKPQLQRRLFAAGLVAALGAGVGAVAQAQMPPAGGPGQHMHGPRDPAAFQARMDQRFAERFNRLKQVLQITPAQEGAWNAWTAAMKPTPHQRPQGGEFAQLTTPERIDRMRAMRAERGAEMDRRMDATKTFYGALSPEQRKAFDVIGLEFMGGHKGGRHHGGHRG